MKLMLSVLISVVASLALFSLTIVLFNGDLAPYAAIVVLLGVVIGLQLSNRK